MAWRTYTITNVFAKKVTCASLIALNLFIAVGYIAMGCGLFPRLFNSTGDLVLEPARYLCWMVALPTLTNLIGDVTSNDAEMKWCNHDSISN